jgi:hypothetical protein
MKINIIKSIVIAITIITLGACNEATTSWIYGDIKVLITDSDQQPISGAEIILATTENNMVLKRFSNELGEVFFNEIIEGKELLVYTTDASYISDQLPVVAVAGTIVTENLVLRPPVFGDLELLVVDENYQVMPEFNVIIKSVVGDVLLTQEDTNSNGKINLTNITGAEYIASPSDSNYLGNLSFNVIPAQLNTATLVVEKIKHYAVSMSKDGYLNPSEMAPYGNSYSISGLIKPTSTGVRTISGFGNAAGYSSFFRLEDDNHLYMGQWSGVFKKAKSGAPLVNDEWSHIALVIDNNEVSFYINGVNVGTTYPNGTAPMDNAISPDNFKFGALYQTGFNFGEAFDGSMDDLAFWSVARTASEIESEATNGLTGNETGLWGYWNFEDNAETTTIDLSGLEHPLEIGGGASSNLLD